jgi:hypothetical protein
MGVAMYAPSAALESGTSKKAMTYSAVHRQSTILREFTQRIREEKFRSCVRYI